MPAEWGIGLTPRLGDESFITDVAAGGKREDAGPFVSTVGSGLVHLRLQILFKVGAAYATLAYHPCQCLQQLRGLSHACMHVGHAREGGSACLTERHVCMHVAHNYLLGAQLPAAPLYGC